MFVKKEKIKEIFVEWDRRFRNNPALFQSEAEKLLKETPYSYGEACSVYFQKLAKEIK